ncbi:unnamed protein product, partial [Darwinula stevensoni]
LCRLSTTYGAITSRANPDVPRPILQICYESKIWWQRNQKMSLLNSSSSPIPSILAICLGASIGAICRWLLGLVFNPALPIMPLGTLLANWLGAYLVGMALVFFAMHHDLDPAWRLLIITGFLGGLTTFSSFSGEVVTQLQENRFIPALVTIALHVLGSLAANPNPTTELNYQSAFELLIAVILSAQATDKSVNIATQRLYRVANTPQGFLELGEETLRDYIASIGLYKTKAANIIKTCHRLVNDFNSEVPKTRQELESLPGVGRKTANVILNTLFGEPLIAVDTHVFRVSNR